MATAAFGSLTPHVTAGLRAVAVCSRIGTRTQARISTAKASITKADASPVTISDLAIQATLTIMLRKELGPVAFVAEEDSSSLSEVVKDVHELVAEALPETKVTEDQVVEALGFGDHPGGAAGQFFVVDPIDGTRGFLRGDQYSIGLGMIDAGSPVLCVMGCPNLESPGGGVGVVFVAVAGHGAWAVPLETPTVEGLKPVVAAPPADITAARMCESFERRHSSHDWSSMITAAVGMTAEPMRLDSMAKYALVARGSCQLYLRLPKAGYSEKIWDHVPGVVLATEAGCTVTDVEGKALDFSKGRMLEGNRGVIVSSGRQLHDAVLAAAAASAEPKSPAL